VSVPYVARLLAMTYGLSAFSTVRHSAMPMAARQIRSARCPNNGVRRLVRRTRGPGRRLNSAVGIDGLYVDC
jgi:hypothetical protein